MHVRLAALLLPSLLLAACSRPPRAVDSADTVQYTMRESIKTVGDCRLPPPDSTTAAPCVAATVRWPDVDPRDSVLAEARKFLRRVASSSFRTGDDLGSPDSAVQAVVGEREAMFKDHKGYNVAWKLARTVDVVCNEPGHFGVRITSTQRTIDPHEISRTRFAGFDTRTGAPIGLESLLRPGTQEQFRASTARAYEASRRGASGTVLVNPDSFPLPRSLLACGDSLVLQYDVIQLGPHRVMGAEFALKRDVVGALLK